MDGYRPIDDNAGPISSTILAAADSVLERWKAIKRAFAPERIEALVEGERWRAAIETGMIEHLYSFGQGVTEQIVQYGLASEETRQLDASVVKQIEGHKNAYAVLLDQIHSGNPVTAFFLRELHSAATAGQPQYEARDSQGHALLRPLARGSYKEQDNHVVLPDGSLHYYAPHHMVESELDRLMTMLHEHANWHPMVLAAFAHHRMTQIHPFADGNGRVSRLLADYYLTSNGYLPLIVTRSFRDSYLRSLREADKGVLAVLVDFMNELQEKEVARVEQRAFSPDLATAVPAAEIARALASVLAAHKRSPISERLVKEDILTPILLEAQPPIERKLGDIARQFSNEGMSLEWRFDGLIWERVTPDEKVQPNAYNVPSLPVRQILEDEGVRWIHDVEIGYLRYQLHTEGRHREYRLRAIVCLTKTGFERVALLTRGTGVDAQRPKLVDVGETPVSWDPWLDESVGRLVVSLAQG